MDYFALKTNLNWSKSKLLKCIRMTESDRVKKGFNESNVDLITSNQRKLTDKQKIGHLILFVAVLTNLVVTALTGFSRTVFGLAS